MSILWEHRQTRGVRGRPSAAGRPAPTTQPPAPRRTRGHLQGGAAGAVVRTAPPRVHAGRHGGDREGWVAVGQGGRRGCSRRPPRPLCPTRPPVDRPCVATLLPL